MIQKVFTHQVTSYDVVASLQHYGLCNSIIIQHTFLNYTKIHWIEKHHEVSHNSNVFVT